MAGFFLNIPETVSPQAQAFLRTLTDPALKPAFPMPDDIEGWKRLQALAEADGRARSEPLLKRYEHQVSPRKLGGVSVLEVRAKTCARSDKVLVYTHGGAHVMYSATSMLGRAVVAAHETGLRVISVDYTLAPHAQYNQMSDEVVRAIQALIAEGQRLEDMAIFGDSSGGGLAAAVVLKMRDRQVGMPRAAVFASPWVMLRRAVILKRHCATQTRLCFTRSTVSRQRRHSLIPRIKKIRTRRRCTLTSPKAFRRHSFRAA